VGKPQAGRGRGEAAKEGLQAGKAASWADHRAAGPEADEDIGRENDRAWKDLQHRGKTFNMRV